MHQILLYPLGNQLYIINHYIKPGYVTSTPKYSYSPESPIIGPGQGSKGAMEACTTMTSPLLQAMDKLVHEVFFCSPNKKQHIRLVQKCLSMTVLNIAIMF